MSPKVRLPPVEASGAKRLLRRARAASEAFERWLGPRRAWFRLALLLLASGALAVSIRVFGWSLNVPTLLSGLLVAGAAAGVASAVLRQVDDLTRNHVGGLRAPLDEAALELPPGYALQVVEPDDELFPAACEFADRFYQGTMAAGRGVQAEERMRERRQLWERKVRQVPGALCLALQDGQEIAALTLVYPLDADTLGLARKGRMDYRGLGQKQLTVDAEDRAREFGLYVSVSIGDSGHLRSLEQRGKDLVGGLLVAHVARLLLSLDLPLDKAVMITDGFRGWSLRSYQRKGFVKLPDRNPYGYPVLELRLAGAATEAFVRAILAAARSAAR